MNTLIRLFERYGYVSPSCKEALEQHIQTSHKTKGSILLKKGQTTGNLFVLEKGLVRGYYEYKEKQTDVWFGFENTILGSTYQLYKSRPSLEYIECMEDCIVHALSNQELLRFYKDFPELNVIGRRFTEDYCLLLEERAFQLQTFSAVERYHDLIKRHPETLFRIPLGNIASYLGISAETLSRIRRI
ncbi:Crp/Fnr family transcriptional regulator [Myroides guanonis]|uniref:cAMP-binding domain of CRP or a regulatory subunit of cAMP-dependent protein kinases n=1 Tax=Myroides guanonis TaxID=1150112 RepID=A0A1I3Q2J5_9FLAO|nr:Crp/Fnr family transcriptional regulator [Myroides guanonis]SFJ27939.1 cAMP-binding domain of CRP or a regulatory subunit of cAMP-dependent protein kinases [Myroides guanonis]